MGSMIRGMAGGGILLAAIALVLVTGCPGTVSPATGPSPGTAAGVGGNSRPTVSIVLPSDNLLLTEGENINVVWTLNDTSGESVIVNLRVVNVITQQTVVNLISNQVFATTGSTTTQTNQFSTSGLAGNTLQVIVTANDAVNPVQQATSPGTIQVVTAGTEPTNAAPTITLLRPTFDQSVAQGDQKLFTWTDADPDSNALIILALDLDTNPNNDNPFNTDDPGIIILGQTVENLDPIINPDDGTITNAFADSFSFDIDVSQIPVRPDGSPYNPCAIITDGGNPAVRSYSAGRIFVTQLAQSPINPALGVPTAVDMSNIGLTVTGATFLGFNPGAYAGWKMRSAGDYDGDGVTDFVLVARFGRPFGYPANVARGVTQGSTGEAYLGYGNPPILLPDNSVSPGARYGGVTNVNSFGTALPGVQIAAPPPDGLMGDNAGITDFAPVPDQPHGALNGGNPVIGDGRPELIFGLAHHNGIPQRRDDDPSDSADEVQFILAANTLDDSYVSPAGPTGAANCFSNLLVIDQDMDDQSNQGGPFAAYLTWTPSSTDLTRMRNLLLSPGAELTANIVLFVNDPGDDGTLFAINVDFDVNPCNIVPGGFDMDDLIDLDAVDGGEVGEIEIEVSDFIAANVLGGRESFAFYIEPDPESPDDGNPFNTLRLQSGEGFNPPRLEISVSQQDSSLGCYPDPFPNNVSNAPPTDDFIFGTIFGGTVPYIPEYLGVAVMLESENRDCDGIIDPNRWTRDSVRLDYAGQQNGLDFDCAGTGTGRTIYGCRWQSTIYDFFDHLGLGQPPIEDGFGQHVDSMPDLDNDQIGEVIISAPTLELDQVNLFSTYGPTSTHWNARSYRGSVLIQFGTDLNIDFFKETTGEVGNSSFPNLPNHDVSPTPACGTDPDPRQLRYPGGFIEIFAESINDYLGGARYAGDFNQDFSPDVVMGAPQADPPGTVDGGKAYIWYGRPTPGPVNLAEANNPATRPPMLRVFGDRNGDRLGSVQGLMQDFDGDGFDDVYVASKNIDFFGGGGGGVDCGAVGIIFGGTEIDGDRDFSQIGTTELPGLIFYGTAPGDFAGADACGNGFFDTERDQFGVFTGLATGGDFNGDGRGDIVICAPGQIVTLPTGQQRQGAVYVIFGDPDLYDGTPGAVNAFPLSLVGTAAIPGIVFAGAFEPGTLDADGSTNALGDLDGAPNKCGYLGDINGDGFSDIAIGTTRADFVDPDAPGSRRADAGRIDFVYGNNFGANNTN